MVQMMRSGNLRPDADTASCRDQVPVKLEIEDPLEDEHGPLSKRSKNSSTFEQWGSGANALPPPSQYNPLDEPSPLGLRLRKSPSLLDLIQMKLSQGSGSSAEPTQSQNFNSGVKKEAKGATAPVITDKLKASNFAASLLKIGRWEYKSRYEGDLVAKCYFAKHKLVWEVLEGGLKSKIEIQWSDIMALKANCPEDGPGTLNVVLARQPLFFRETNPQPRKHTLWQATADFTDGQASIHRQHFLECPQGLLNKHFDKLIQCDMRLNFLSQQPEIVLDSPYFESRASVFEDQVDSKKHGFDTVDSGKGSVVSSFPDVASPTPSQSSSINIDQSEPSGIGMEQRSREAPSPSSVMDTRAIEGSGNSEASDSKGARNWDNMKVPGLHPSMSMSDLMNHLGNCISEQMTAGNPAFTEDQPDCQGMLESIAQYLFSDTQLTTSASDEKLMSRVNSLCCLLQKDPSIQNLQAYAESLEEPRNGSNIMSKDKAPEGELKDGSCSKQPLGMSRKDSFSDLLLHLPRIASLPKFLFNISEEDGESQAR
jgi:hypothetical protein